MSPLTGVFLVAAGCLALLGHDVACYVAVVVAAINQGIFAWASQPGSE